MTLGGVRMQGVERYKVRLLPHCEEWKDEFKEAKKQLKEILGDNIVDIQHVGSTSINGICAKPILDIAVVVKSFEDMNIDEMKRTGYDYCGPQNKEKNRYLFVLRGEGQISLRHVHCYEPNSTEFYFVTRFRDFLNEHEEYAKEYNDLKISLSKQYPDDRITYTSKKESFIKMIYEKISLENIREI